MRQVIINRNTLETSIELRLNLDGSKEISIDTGIGFFDHMLKAMAFYAEFDIELKCLGDLDVDSHHTIEDIGLVFGAALKESLGDRRGIARFSSTITPMDESLALIAIDISNRPYLVDNLSFKSDKIGNMDTQDFKEFFRAFAFSAGITLHIDLMRGENDHHKIEAVFKGLGRALKEALTIKGNEVISTKGVL
ncbi:imidazoleglycerol-phosphate dehydratase HisB [Tissierella creatinini]|nr:imidazoleglycerol-phosphate dehydratase HisB [Tissierella creatinini]TJX66745.1 imidazoleglycerol-phosphate dehydratase HisB [Soehngenia saccharolytica]